ncbi:DUF3150 domain-containing protein [Verrucomicrobiales bacterium BCK34]|nr:DUF3150 domain-containing protein [Verrucomicrobiales bacterium BCK34]
MNPSTPPNTDLLQVLTREGVLINASVRYPRFHKKLRAADLGLEPDQVNERLLSLGHKKLLPKEALAELALIESRTHAIIDKSTFPFLGGIGHFLPNAKLVDVQEQLNSQNLCFTTARDKFLSDYRITRESALQDWRDATRQMTKSYDEAETLYSQIVASFPPREYIEDKFAFTVHLFQIAVPEDLGIELISFAEQNEVRMARHEAASTASREIQNGVAGFVSECVTELRQQTAQLCDEMLASMRGGKTPGVHQKTLNRLTRFIDDFKQLNFADDSEMEAQLERVRSELLHQTAEDYRNNPSSTRSLESGLTQLRNHARDLANQDAAELVERFGQMGRRKLQLAG